jgi:hypothetical protein
MLKRTAELASRIDSRCRPRLGGRGVRRYLVASSVSWETVMRAKTTVRNLRDRLPDECSLQEVLYHLYVIAEIEKGSLELEAGREISHEQVEQELRQKWRLRAG